MNRSAFRNLNDRFTMVVFYYEPCLTAVSLSVIWLYGLFTFLGHMSYRA